MFCRWFFILTGIMVIPAWGTSVKTGGKMFLNWNYVLSPENVSGYNAFDITRTYLTVKGSLTEEDKEGLKINFRVTTDLKRLVDGYYTRFLKYAYIEFADIPGDLKLRLGQNPVPWVGFEEHIWGLRFVSPVFADVEGLLTSTDLGFSVLWDFPENYGDLQFSVVNGEGYHNTEPNKYKDMMARASIRPVPENKLLSGLRLHGYYGYGIPDTKLVRNRVITAISYEGKFLTLMGEYLGSQDGHSDSIINGSGFSGFIVLHRRDYGVFGRFETFDPNTRVDTDGHSRYIAGVYYKITKGVRVALDYQTVIYEDTNIESAGVLYLHFLLKF